MTPSGVWTYEWEFSNILHTRTRILDLKSLVHICLRTRSTFLDHSSHTLHNYRLYPTQTKSTNMYEAKVDNNQATVQENHQVATFQRRKSLQIRHQVAFLVPSLLLVGRVSAWCRLITWCEQRQFSFTKVFLNLMKRRLMEMYMEYDYLLWAMITWIKIAHHRN